MMQALFLRSWTWAGAGHVLGLFGGDVQPIPGRGEGFRAEDMGSEPKDVSGFE